MLFWYGNRSLDLQLSARDQNNPPAHASRMFSNARYVSTLGTSSVRERAKRADALVSLHSLRTINPQSSRMSRKSRFARSINAPLPALERVTGYGGSCRLRVYIRPFRHFCHFLRHPLRFKRYNPRIIQNAISKP